MERLTYEGPERRACPGPDESWRELAEHSFEHDQLSTEVPRPEAFRQYVSGRRAALVVPSAEDLAWARGRWPSARREQLAS